MTPVWDDVKIGRLGIDTQRPKRKSLAIAFCSTHMPHCFERWHKVWWRLWWKDDIRPAQATPQVSGKEIITEMTAKEVARVFQEKQEAIDPGNILPIMFNGGIGDAVAIIDSLNFLTNQGFEIEIFTHHPEAVSHFSPQYKIHTKQKFTWYLQLDTVARWKTSAKFSKFSNEKHSALFQQQQDAFSHDFELSRINFTESYFMVAAYAAKHGLTNRTMPMHCLGYLDIPKTFHTLPARQKRKQITIHDGIDNNHKIQGRATKQWSHESWTELVAYIRSNFPEYKIIQLGSGDSRPIKGVNKSLLNKTTIPQAFDILRESRLHIDSDSGLVHAAARLQTKSIVLWGPTAPRFYGYDQNVNLYSNHCGQPCYGVVRDWNQQCPAGFLTPRCMDDITAAKVFEQVQRELKK